MSFVTVIVVAVDAVAVAVTLLTPAVEAGTAKVNVSPAASAANGVRVKVE
jgi:hypothetical protein